MDRNRENRIWTEAVARKPEMGNTPSMLDCEARMKPKAKITWGEFKAYVEGQGVREDTVIDCISVSNIKDKITEINVWQVEDNTVLIDEEEPMTLEEMITRFDVSVSAECEASVARLRVMLRNDAAATVLFDQRIEQYREAFKAGAYQGAKAWRMLELEIEPIKPHA